MSFQEELTPKIIASLKEVYDPEIPVNIYDLGFIYGIDVTDEGDVHILMTLTIPGCPIHHFLTRDIKERLSRIDGVKNIEVELTFEPRWDISRITDDGIKRLRELGYNV